MVGVAWSKSASDEVHAATGIRRRTLELSDGVMFTITALCVQTTALCIHTRLERSKWNTVELGGTEWSRMEPSQTQAVYTYATGEKQVEHSRTQ